MCTNPNCRCGYLSAQDKLETCPHCGNPKCEADWVDVGVGEVQCGPYHCEACGASEIGPEAGKPGWVRPEGAKHGWYPPEHPPSPYANTMDGKIITAEEARGIYREARFNGEDVKWEGTLLPADAPSPLKEGDDDA